MALEFWLILAMIAGGACGLALGFVFWKMDDTKERDIPDGDDYQWND